jgi:hypothetical protein
VLRPREVANPEPSSRDAAGERSQQAPTGVQLDRPCGMGGDDGFDVTRQRKLARLSEFANRGRDGARVWCSGVYPEPGERRRVGPDQPRDARQDSAQHLPARCTRSGSSPVS